MATDYMAQAAEYLERAAIAASTGTRDTYMAISARYERLAAIERGLLPGEVAEAALREAGVPAEQAVTVLNLIGWDQRH